MYFAKVRINKIYIHILTYILTYLLTPWNGFLLEKLTGFAANQEILRISWNPKVHYRTHKRPPHLPSHTELNSNHRINYSNPTQTNILYNFENSR